MGSSRLDVVIHFTWQTKYRQSVLVGPLEIFVHREIRTTADEYDLPVVAVNSAWDHVHALVRWNASTTIREFVQYAKGRTAYRWNNECEESDDSTTLEWQEGYGAFSVSYNDVETVRRYVDRQKEHHRDRKLWWKFERHLWREE